MSKSYARYRRVGNCVGSNTSYYRQRRRLYRARWKANMVRAFQRSEVKFPEILSDTSINLDYYTTIDDVYVHPEKEHKFIDRWDEPTDGSWYITSKDIKRYFDSGDYSRRHGNYCVKGKNKVKK